MRRIYPLRLLVLFLLLCTTNAYSQTYPESDVCSSAEMAVGEIPNSPLTADIVLQKRPVLHDGSLGLLFYSRHVGFVARDSHGKVIVRIAEAPDDPNWKPGQKDANIWHEYVCDPTYKSTTELIQTAMYAHHFVVVLPRYNSHGQPYFHTTVVFSAWHNVVPGRQNLGEETFENLPAYRYRITKTAPPRSFEVVNSDELAVELLHGIWYSDPAIAVETRLTNLHFTEPSKDLMAIPAWAYSRMDRTPQSMAPGWTMRGVPQSPFPNP